MWMGILVAVINADMTKVLIGMLFKKLLEHKNDGITHDVINTVLDAAVKSKANNITEELIAPLKF